MTPVLVALAAWEYRGRLGQAMLAGMVAGVLVLGPTVGPTVVSRLTQLGSVRTDMSYRIRRDNLINAIQIFRSRTWLGCGLGGFPRAWWKTRSLDTFIMQYDWDWEAVEPDMNYVRLLAETGAVGLGLNLAFYAAMALLLWRRRRSLRSEGRRDEADFASAVLLTWALFLMASAIQDTSLYLRTWLTFGLTISFSTRSKNERNAD